MTNKMLRFLAIASTLIIAACHSDKPPTPVRGNHGGMFGASAGSSDPFRIGMKYGHSANSPSSPAPIPPATCWYDVPNWQTFLRTHGSPSLVVTGTFDPPTQTATTAFQHSQYGGAVVIGSDAVVNLATYTKARNAGMPAYPRVP